MLGIVPQLAAALTQPLLRWPYMWAWALLLAHLLQLPAGSAGRRMLSQGLRELPEYVTITRLDLIRWPILHLMVLPCLLGNVMQLVMLINAAETRRRKLVVERCLPLGSQCGCIISSHMPCG